MKTICIYHRIDLDGWMSAAIVKHWFFTKSPEPYMTGINLEDYIDKSNDNNNGEVESVSNWNILDFLGWNYGDDIPDLSEYDKVIMVDVSFPKEEMDKLFNSLLVDFIWIDHHKSAIKHSEPYAKLRRVKGIRDTKYAACELAWEYFFPNSQVPEIVMLLGMYDSFRHKGTEEEQKVLEFQYGARQVISNYEEAYDKLYRELNKSEESESLVDEILGQGKAIYQYLCTEAKQVYKNGFEVLLFEIVKIHSSIQIRPRKFICINKERFNPVNFEIDYHKDGYDGAVCFHYANGMWNFSLYNDNGKVDCSQIAKQFGGGGHKGAAGFRIESIEEFFKSYKICQ